MKTNQVALGVLAGLAAGAIIGLLFAPAKGSETRKKLAGKGRDVVDGIKERVSEFSETITETLESAGNLVGEVTERVSKPQSVKRDIHNPGTNEKNHQHPQTNQNRS